MKGKCVWRLPITSARSAASWVGSELGYVLPNDSHASCHPNALVGEEVLAREATPLTPCPSRLGWANAALHAHPS